VVLLEQNQIKLAAFVSYDLGLNENRLKYLQAAEQAGNFLWQSVVAKPAIRQQTLSGFTASYNISYSLFYFSTQDRLF